MFKSICERGQKCSCFIDSLFNKNWSKCCSGHDDNYINNKYDMTKDEADDMFYTCLKNNTWKWLAWLMYMAVSKSSIAQNYWDKYRSKDK